MQLPKWFRNFFKTEIRLVGQSYRDDRKYTYLLILIARDGKTFNRTYSTSSPLNTGHRIVLAPGKAFTATYIVHVTYSASVVPALTRPTTFVHVGVIPDNEQKLSEAALIALDFCMTESILPYTIH